MLRDQLLNGESFCTLRESKVPLERWHRHHDRVRPCIALGYEPPSPEATLASATGLT